MTIRERDSLLAPLVEQRRLERAINEKKNMLSAMRPSAARQIGAAVALLAGQDALAAKGDESTAEDVRILNTALGAELEAIAAYQLGAESGLLQKPVLDLAVTFQGDTTRSMPTCWRRKRFRVFGCDEAIEPCLE